MPTKRIILANGPRLLREMLQRVINKMDNLEVVLEITNYEELPSAIERFDPEWVITSSIYDNRVHKWIDACMVNFPSVRFMFLSPAASSIKMKWQVSHEEDLEIVSLNDFIAILARDLQHT